MKISIIVPIYNAEKTIVRLINSIQSQTYDNYELILIDDGSTDKSYDIIREYNSEKIKIFSKSNEGVGKTRKFGFEKSTGDLIFFCDSDDYLSSIDVLEKINKIFSEKEIDILMFDAIDLTKNGKRIVNCFSKYFEPGFHNIEEIDSCFLFGPLFLKIFKRDKLDDASFVEDNNFEDTYTTYQYLNKCDIFYYEKDIYYVYDETSNENSLTKNKDINKFIKTIDLIETIYTKSKLKNSCRLSAFNYYIYLITLIETQTNWNANKINELKIKMLKLEIIFNTNFPFIEQNFPKENIEKYYKFKRIIFDKKIIIVDGISTTGKSTISEMLYNILYHNKIKVKWLHEESYNETNLCFDISRGDINKIDLIKQEMECLFKRWEEFYKKITKDDNVYILDSNFFKNIHDYLLHSNLTEKEIIDYFNLIINIFEKNEILFVLLKRNDIKRSFFSSFENRGFFWESHFKSSFPKESSYIKYKTNDEEIIYEYEKEYQSLIEKIFEQFGIEKKKIETDEEEWEKYIDEILKRFPLNKKIIIEENYDYSKYLGKFSCENWHIEIYYNYEERSLYLSAFWPKIKLKYLGENRFKLDKFPLEIHFFGNKVIFYGDLIWEMKNKEFIKNKTRILKK